MGRFLVRVLKCLGGLVATIITLGSLVAAARHPGLGAFLVAGGLATVGMGACSLVCGALFSKEANRLRQIMEGQTLRCWLLGMFLVVAQVWVVTTLPAKGLFILAFLLFDLYCLARTCGVLAGWVGSGLCQNERWQPGVGGLVLGLSAAAPLLGWAVSLQLLLVSLGAAICPQRWSQA